MLVCCVFFRLGFKYLRRRVSHASSPPAEGFDDHFPFALDEEAYCLDAEGDCVADQLEEKEEERSEELEWIEQYIHAIFPCYWSCKFLAADLLWGLCLRE